MASARGYVTVPRDWRWECGFCGKSLTRQYVPAKASGLCTSCLTAYTANGANSFVPEAPPRGRAMRDRRVVEMEDLRAILGVRRAEEVYREASARYAPPLWVATLPVHVRLAYSVAAWIKAYNERPCSSDLAPMIGRSVHRTAMELARARRKGTVFAFSHRSLADRPDPMDRPNRRIPRRYYEPNWSCVPERLREPRPSEREVQQAMG